MGKHSGGYYEAGLGRLINAFGSDTEGTDGGTFVEFYSLSDGAGAVPYAAALGRTSNPSAMDFSSVWFKNQGKTNYIHVIGAR